MAAGHSHDHSRARSVDYGRAFAIGIALNLGFVVVEAVYGFLAGSMALIADAGHNLSDVLGLVVAWAGAMMARSSAVAALHLRAQEGVDPRRADQRLAAAGRGRRDRRRSRSAGCSIRRRPTARR